MYKEISKKFTHLSISLNFWYTGKYILFKIIIIICIDANDDGWLPLVVGDTYQQPMVYDPHLAAALYLLVNLNIS